jgi:hypothetical protein
MKLVRLLALCGVLMLSSAVVGCFDDDDDDDGDGKKDVAAQADSVVDKDQAEPGDAAAPDVAEGDAPAVEEVAGETAQEDVVLPCQVDDCVNVGEKSCSPDGLAVMECQQAGECKQLVQIEVCAAPAACEAGACVAASSEACKQIVMCGSGCGGNQACVQNCYDISTPEGKTAYEALQTCGTSKCAGQTSAATQSKCIVQNCPDQWTGCVGPWGTGNCLGILNCAKACANAACQVECVFAADQSSQLLFWDFQICASDKCLQQCSGQDANACQQCIMANCMASATACMNDK